MRSQESLAQTYRKAYLATRIAPHEAGLRAVAERCAAIADCHANAYDYSNHELPVQAEARAIAAGIRALK